VCAQAGSVAWTSLALACRSRLWRAGWTSGDAMWLMFGSKSKTIITKGGERLKRKCPKCGVTGDFHEARTETSVSAFVVLELLKDEAVVFVCAACHETVPKAQTLPPVLSPAEQAKEEKQRHKEELEVKKRSDRAAVATKAKLDGELAALKKKMGI
jgi:hypothetical protein